MRFIISSLLVCALVVTTLVSATNSTNTTLPMITTTVAPSTTADVTTQAPITSLTATTLNPPPAPTTSGATTAAPSKTARVIINLKDKSFAATEKARKELKDKLAALLQINSDMLTITLGDNEEQVIVTIDAPQSNNATAIADQMAALPESELQAMGATSISVETTAAPTPADDNNMIIIIAAACGGVLLIGLIAYAIKRNKDKAEDKKNHLQPYGGSDTGALTNMEKELRTARNQGYGAGGNTRKGDIDSVL